MKRTNHVLGCLVCFCAVLLSLRAEAQTTNWPARLVAPYVDFAGWPLWDIVGTANSTGLRYCTLAFVIADPSQNPTNAAPAAIPAWGGYTDYSVQSAWRKSDMDAFRALGGDVIISFGGASGTELAAYITDTNRLKAAYQAVINTYHPTWLDFDIEGAWVAEHPSINRRSAVLASLQAEAAASNQTLKVWLTLPVLPTGLDANGLYVLQSAVSNNVDLGGVNVMAMDYGDGAAPNPSGHMGDYAIMAATNLFNQIKAAYQAAGKGKTDAQLWKMVGVTPMIGLNDVQTEVFDLSAALQLVSFATNRDVGLLAFWSVNRDQPGQSGITQQAYQFTDLFLAFSGGGSNLAPMLSVADASVIEGHSGTTNLVFNVSLAPAATNTVTVGYVTANGTAVAPGDYYATNGTLTFTPGQTSATIIVRVIGDTNVEPDETFTLTLTNASGATLGRSQATGTIFNDDQSPSTGGSGGECAVTSQWTITYNGAAFRATQTLSNPNPTNLTINTFEFDAPYTSVDWLGAGNDINWVIPAHSGTHFTASGWSPAAVIPAGGTLQLLYQASPGGSPPAPANVKINGVLLGDCGITTPRFLSAQRIGNDVWLSWTTTAGKTNLVQWSPALTGPSAGWTNLSNPLVIPGVGPASTNWSHWGAATNSTAGFYRIVLKP